MASGRLRLHGRCHHVLAGFRHMAEKVAQEVHPAPLPATALEHAPDRRRQPQVGNRHHKPGASQATLLLLRRSLRLEGAEELAPEALSLAVTHGDAEHLAVAEVIDTDRYHHGP